MVSDSPYKVDHLALSPLTGVITGILGAFLMLGVVGLMQPYSGLSIEAVLAQFGTLVLPKRFEQISLTSLMSIALGVHILIRALLSLLYAVCQQRIPARGLIAVGIFYGFILWVTSGVILGAAIGPGWRQSARSWTWLMANVVFGLCLATTSIVAQIIRPAEVMIVPKD